jgi:two-component system phosphate regulon response regulator OmpR
MRELRAHWQGPVIIVSGRGDSVERVVGLELGADDYVTKPFDLRELLARVRSVLRRIQARAPPQAGSPGTDAPPPASRRRSFGRCEVDVESHRMFESDGAEVSITAMEYELVATFLANPNRVLTRDQLLMKTRNREWEPFDRSIDIRIGRLRRKVEPDPAGEPRVIRTVRNAGYMFVPDAH